MAIKKLLITFFLVTILFSLAFQTSPYARRIRPFASTPSSCQENEIGYNMTSHSILICTNSGYQALATGGSGSFAPVGAKYIVQTTDGILTNEQALGALSTGILKNTTTTGTGILSIAIASDFPADSGLPTQTGNSGKYLTTNGTISSWNTVSAGITNSALANTIPLSDGTNLGSSLITQVAGVVYIDGVPISAMAQYVRTTAVHVSSADILAINAVPKTIIAAPGSTKYIVPIMSQWTWNHGTTPYTLPAGVFLHLSNPAMEASSTFDGWFETPATGLLDTSNNLILFPEVNTFNGAANTSPVFPISPSPPINPSLLLNQPIYLSNDRVAAAYTDGDGTIDVTVTYMIIDTVTGQVEPVFPASDSLSGSGSANALTYWTNSTTIQAAGGIETNGSKFISYNNSAPLDGELLIGKTSATTFEKATLTAGSGISITNGSGTITISSGSVDATITSGGTTGAQTIDKSAGSVNFAATDTSLVVTNSTVAANSIINCTVQTNDTTLKSVQCVPASGSFTMFANAAATAETRVAFTVITPQ